jgi:protein regulator of cytokinesis 1
MKNVEFLCSLNGAFLLVSRFDILLSANTLSISLSLFYSTLRNRQGIEAARNEIISTSKALKVDLDESKLLLSASQPSSAPPSSASDESSVSSSSSSPKENKISSKSTMNLTEILASLQLTLQNLREQSIEARTELESCHAALKGYHKSLDKPLDELYEDISSDLTDERRVVFRTKVGEMRAEVDIRTDAIVNFLVDCQGLIAELVIESEVSELDRKIMGSLSPIENSSESSSSSSTAGSNKKMKMRSMSSSETCTGISDTALANLTDRCAELNGEKKRRKAKLSELGAEIAQLWEKLKVPESEQRKFMESVEGLGLNTLMKGEQEVLRLHELKSAMLGNLILEARQTIAGLWEETCVNQEGQNAFEAGKILDEASFTDEVLAAHDDEIAKLHGRLEQMRPLLKMIEKREEILAERVKYDELQKDPERLKGRGATQQLMLEEKMNKRIKKDLPKYTEALLKRLKDWAAETGEAFKYGKDAENYSETMVSQEAEWQKFKDMEAAAKLEKKQAEKIGGSAGGKNNFKKLPGTKKTRLSAKPVLGDSTKTRQNSIS